MAGKHAAIWEAMGAGPVGHLGFPLRPPLTYGRFWCKMITNEPYLGPPFYNGQAVLWGRTATITP